MNSTGHRSGPGRRILPPRMILIVLLAGAVSGCASLPSVSSQTPVLDFEHYELPNGLDVILAPDSTAAEVVVNVWYHVGSRDEEPGRHGFAHVFEHLMFLGSKHHDNDFNLAIRAVGGRANGMTDRDRTVYWMSIPPENLELALWLEADRMGFVLDALTEEKLQKQIAIVLNELSRNATMPYEGVDREISRLLFPPGHPYSWTVAGEPSELGAANLEEVAGFFRRHYSPNQASICIAGPFETKNAHAWIRRYFASLPSGPDPVPWSAPIPLLTRERRSQLRDDVKLPQVTLAWNTPGRFQPGDIEFDVLAQVLGAPGSGRLQQSLRGDPPLAQEIRIRQRSREEGSTFEIEVTAAPGADLAAIEQTIDAELESIRLRGPSPAEVARARAGLEAEFLRGLEQRAGFGGPANRLNRYLNFLGDPDWLGRDFQRLRDCTSESVRDVAGRYLMPSQRAVVRVVPGAKETPPPIAVVRPESDPLPTLPPVQDPPDLDRFVRPGPGKPLPFDAPSIRSRELENGLRYHLVQRPGLPLVEIHLNVRGGWSADAVPGTCALTAKLLAEKAQGASDPDLAERLAQQGAILEGSSNFDASLFRLNVPRAGLEDAGEVLAALVLRPEFSQEAFERVRRMTLGRHQLEQSRPRTVAIQTMQQEVFGPRHPYAQPFTGTGKAADLAVLNLTQLREFYRRWYRPGNVELVLVGDLTPETADRLVRKWYAAWSQQPTDCEPVAMLPATGRPGIVILDQPGSEQATLVGGCETVSRADASRKPLLLLNQALGRGQASRLFGRLRTEKAYSYRARSQMVNYRQAGFFVVDAAVQTGHAGDALEEILRELRDLGTSRPLAGAELDRVLTETISDFPRRFETLESIATGLDRILVCNLPLNEWNTVRSDFVEAAQGDLATLARRYLAPERMTWVIVGDWEEMKAGFAGFASESIEVRPFRPEIQQ